MQLSFCDQQIMVVDDVFDAALCDQIIRKYQSDPRRTDPFSSKHNARPYREGKCLTITRYEDWKDIDGRVHAALTQALGMYVDRYKLLTPNIQDTGYTVADFEPGQGTNLHIDSIHGASCFRLVTVVAYLNDVAEGGETYFPEQLRHVSAKRGQVVLFPPYFTHPHMANPPIGQSRYILVTWAMSDPNLYKPGDPV